MREYVSELVSMILQGLGEVIVGFLWSLASPILERHPTILAVLPGFAEDRGAVYGSTASKYSTMLYLGEASSFTDLIKSKVTKIAFTTSLIIGFYVILLSSLVGNPFDALLYFLVSRPISLALVIPLTAWLATLVFKRGWNVDFIVVPLVSVIADIIAAASIFLVFTPLAYPFIVATLLTLVHEVFALIKYRKDKDFRTLLTSGILATTFSTFAGIVLAGFQVAKDPAALAVAPLILALNGSAAMAFASWLSTNLHLGYVEPWKINKSIVLAWSRLTLWLIIALSVSSLTFYPAYRLSPLLYAVIASVIQRALVTPITYVVSVESFRRGLDPDLITIPLLSSVSDLLGALSLALTTRII